MVGRWPPIPATVLTVTAPVTATATATALTATATFGHSFDRGVLRTRSRATFAYSPDCSAPLTRQTAWRPWLGRWQRAQKWVWPDGPS